MKNGNCFALLLLPLPLGEGRGEGLQPPSKPSPNPSQREGNFLPFAPCGIRALQLFRSPLSAESHAPPKRRVHWQWATFKLTLLNSDCALTTGHDKSIHMLLTNQPGNTIIGIRKDRGLPDSQHSSFIQMSKSSGIGSCLRADKVIDFAGGLIPTYSSIFRASW